MLNASDSLGSNESISSLGKELQDMTKECQQATENIVGLLNNFDCVKGDLLLSVRHIENVVLQTSTSVNEIMEYLNQQSNNVVNPKPIKPLFTG